MPYINKVFLMGHLGKTPELRYTTSGMAVGNFSIATTEYFRPKGGGERQKRTEWHNVTVWDKLAERVSEWCQKGTLVFVEGRIQTDKWEDKEGNKRQTKKIIAHRVLFLSKLIDREDRAPSPGRKNDEEEPPF